MVLTTTKGVAAIFDINTRTVLKVYQCFTAEQNSCRIHGISLEFENDELHALICSGENQVNQFNLTSGDFVKQCKSTKSSEPSKSPTGSPDATKLSELPHLEEVANEEFELDQSFIDLDALAMSSEHANWIPENGPLRNNTLPELSLDELNSVGPSVITCFSSSAVLRNSVYFRSKRSETTSGVFML